MTDTFHGEVSAVTARQLGTQLAAAAIIGDTVLQVVDAGEFNHDGGTLSLDGTLLPYVERDLDSDVETITLAAPLVVAFDVDARIDVWDDANNMPAVVYYAIVDNLDGFAGDPVQAVVDQAIAHVFVQAMRTSKGESVTLTRDSSGQLRVTQVHGRAFALAALQYLQGGMTTRQADDEAGVDILGAESGTPGILAYSAGGDVTVRIDAETGDATFIGELGTADPSDPGIFLFSQQFSFKGALHTKPTVQFNTGATRDQPSIQADAAGDGSGLSMYSGASTGERESHVYVDNGQITLAIERTANSDPDFGSLFLLNDTQLSAVIHKGSGWGGALTVANDQILLQSDYQFGPNNLAAVLIGLSSVYILGYRDNATGELQGMAITRAGDLVLATQGAVDVQNPNSTAFKPINASAFNVSSDSAEKTDVDDSPDALAIVTKAPAKRWRYQSDAKSVRRIGPMADDLPAWMTQTLPKSHAVAPNTKTVDLARLNGVLWRAAEQLAEKNADLQAQVDDLAARLERIEHRLPAEKE